MALKVKKKEAVVVNPTCIKTGLTALGAKNDILGHAKCKYIIGAPFSGNGWHMCGHQTHKSSSWCKKHFDVVSQVVPYRPRELKPFKRS